MDPRTVKIPLAEINPFVRRAAINPLNPGFSTGFRKIYHYQIQYIYKGLGTIDVEGVQYKASKGDLFFWGPAQEHRITSSAEEPLTILGVQFDFTRNHENKKYPPDISGEFNPENINEIVHFTDFTGFVHHIAMYNLSLCEYLLLDIAKEFKTRKLFYKDRAGALLKAFLLMCARQISTGNRHDGEVHHITDSIIQYIHENYNKKLTNRDIAGHFKFHPNYINRLINASTGMSMHEYVINVRIGKAVELLSNTGMSISEVAAAVGFDNVYYFSGLFKKKLGCPPSAIKNL